MDEGHPTSGSSPPADSTGSATAAVGLKHPREEAQVNEPCEGSRQVQQRHCCHQGPQQPTTTPAAPAPAAESAVAVKTSSSHPEDHPLDPNARQPTQFITPPGNTPPGPPVTCMAAIAEAAAAAATAMATAAAALEQPEARENAAHLLSVGGVLPLPSWKEKGGGCIALLYRRRGDRRWWPRLRLWRCRREEEQAW